MATSTKVVNITQDDIVTAVQEWLHKKYPGDARNFNIQLQYHTTTRGIGPMETDSTVFTAVATREE